MYMALVDDGKKVIRVNFNANKAESIKEFKQLVGEGKKYKAGLLLDNRWRDPYRLGPNHRLQVYARGSSGEFEDLGMDIHELVGRYLQDLGNPKHKKAHHNQKDLNLLTVAVLKDRRHDCYHKWLNAFNENPLVGD